MKCPLTEATALLLHWQNTSHKTGAQDQCVQDALFSSSVALQSLHLSVHRFPHG